jgi:hypothetical protein
MVIEDLNMPRKDEYGAQESIEFIKYFIDKNLVID